MTQQVANDADPSTSSRSLRLVVARVLPALASPVVVATALRILAGRRTTDSVWGGIGGGLLAMLCACLLPFAAVLVLMRRGRVTDHHIRVRSQRAAPLSVAVVSTGVGIAVLAGLGAPAELLVVVVAMGVGLVVALAINLVWKASIHTAVMAGAVVCWGRCWAPGGCWPPPGGGDRVVAGGTW
jgi:hypothetical protein